MKEAVGMVETRGYAAAVEAADAMCKAANVTISDFSYVGSGLMAVVVSGEVAAVQASVESGREAAQRVAEVISYNVIPRPHEEVEKMMQ